MPSKEKVALKTTTLPEMDNGANFKLFLNETETEEIVGLLSLERPDSDRQRIRTKAANFETSHR